MCGIAGFIGYSELDVYSARNILDNMCAAIVHRGPDDSGLWFDNQKQVALGHRRLSIIELSEQGHQPMQSESARYVLIFNGEVYNHLDLRDELQTNKQAPNWRGTSDTETLLAGFDAWGIMQTVQRSVGMFAFAVWDKHEKKLTLGRDRIGEKPLYYGWQGIGVRRSFVFASELKALKQHPEFNPSINRQALALYMQHSYVPAPHSIYVNVKKLMPGHLLTVSLQTQEVLVQQYWSLAAVTKKANDKPFAMTLQQATTETETLLKQAVRQQMEADVPLGAFLSGGIDSSTIVALMQAQSTQAVKTYTIGFKEATFNEAQHAQAVAQHLGTNHTTIDLTYAQAINVIPSLPKLYCEPFADSSQIPTFLVSELAHQSVKVALSGDAGDEIFCGYNRYIIVNQLWAKLAYLPSSLRQLIATWLLAVSPQKWDYVLNHLFKLLPNRWRQANIGDKVHKGARVLASNDYAELYNGLTTCWPQLQELIKDYSELTNTDSEQLPRLPELNNIEQMMLWDSLTYLPDDILTKVDRAAMGVSLEVRVPFLDHRLIEHAWKLPLSMKLNQGQNKWILRKILSNYVPKTLIERPKMGFAIPVGEWLRGPLRNWAEDLLDPSRLHREGFFHPQVIREKWQEHLTGQYNWQTQLWNVLMFQAWLDKEHYDAA